MGLIEEMRESRFWDEWKSRFEKNSHKYITPNNPTVQRAADRANVRNGTDYDIGHSVWNHVYKKVNYNLSKEWKTPAQTLREMEGDCEDVTFLVASMLLNLGVDNVAVTIGDLIFPDGKEELHTWVEVDKMVIDATGSPRLSGDVSYRPVKKYRL